MFGDVFDPAAGLPPPGQAGSPVIVSATAPVQRWKGMAWLDTNTQQLKVFDGTTWLLEKAMPRGTKSGQILTTIQSPWEFEIQDTIDEGRF